MHHVPYQSETIVNELSSARSLLAIPGPNDPFCPGPMVDLPVTGPVLRALTANPQYRTLLLLTKQRDLFLEKEIAHRFPCIDIQYMTSDKLRGGPHHDFLLSGDHSRSFPILRKILDGELAARPVYLVPNPTKVKLIPFPIDAKSKNPSDPIVREPTTNYGTRPRTSLTPRIDHRRPQPDRETVIRELGLLGESPSFTRVLDGATVLARHELPVLIQGETGTGKELFARLIHQLSSRHREPFVPVNCGALPAQLIESILFGHRKGAFTGAQSDQSGKFELAHGGTLFLDELGELPLELQPKLLRVLEDGVIEPIGSSTTRQVNVRIVAATNLELRNAIEENRFREDLYYRLAVGLIRLPSLRERSDDIASIAIHILHEMNQGLAEPRQFTPCALRRLSEYPWPGNVRDLQNTIRRSALWSVCPLIEAEDLIFDQPSQNERSLDTTLLPEEGFSLEEHLGQVRKKLILRALDLSRGNQSAAAKRLGISPQAVHKFLKLQNIQSGSLA